MPSRPALPIDTRLVVSTEENARRPNDSVISVHMAKNGSHVTRAIATCLMNCRRTLAQIIATSRRRVPLTDRIGRFAENHWTAATGATIFDARRGERAMTAIVRSILLPFMSRRRSGRRVAEYLDCLN